LNIEVINGVDMMEIRNKRASVAMISSAAVLMVGLTGCGASKNSETLLSDAKQYQQKGDNKAAVIQLKNILQKDPDNKDARYLLGNIYSQTGDALSAEKELRKAVSLGLDPALALPGLAKALLMQGQYQKMLDDTATDPRVKTDADFASLRGNAFLALGKKSEAKEMFDSALKSSADFPEALIGLAKLAVVERDLDSANRYANLATEKNPTYANAWFFKGELLRGQGKRDEALAALEKTVKLAPENSAAFLVKANLEIELKKYVEAAQDVDAAKKLGSNQVLTFYTQGLLDYSQNKFPAALESMQQVQKYAPDYMPGVLLSGSIQLALGANELAEQHLKKYLEKNPENEYAQKLMVSIFLKSAQTQRAIAQIQPLLKSKTADGQLYGLAGEVYMQAKDFNKATEYFEKASALVPESSAIHTALAMSKLGQGDSVSAIAELGKATNLDSKSPRAGILLVMTHIRLKEFDKALAVAIATEKDHPNNPVIQNIKGGIYLSKNDNQNARASFEKAISLEPAYLPALTNLAQMDLKEKKPEVAKKRFEAVLEKDKKNIQVMAAIAGISHASGDNQETEKWLVRANTENPNAVEPTRLLAAHYSRTGEKQKAIALVRKAQTSNPKEPIFVEMLAKVQLEGGDMAGALDSFTKFAAMQPESPSAQFAVATTNMSMNNVPAAIDSLKKTLRLDAKYLPAQLAMSTLLAKKGNFDEALLISRQIQQQDQKSSIGHVQEGDILLLQKKAALAFQAYERGFKIEKNSQTITKIHRSLVIDGKIKEADARIEQWLKEHADDKSVRMYFAGHYLTNTKTMLLGIQHLQVLLKSDGNNVAVLNNLAWALGEQKDPKALEYAEKALKLAPDSPAIMDTLGWILVEQGNVNRGLPLIQKAIVQMPDSLDVRFHLGTAFMKSGNKAAARKEFEQILSVGKEFAKREEIKTMLKQL
jgi:putative PEP-CTERM system TPR-repeat lipoprotein